MPPNAKRAEWVAIVCLVVTTLSAIGVCFLYFWNAAACTGVLIDALILVMMIWLIVWMHQRLRRAAAEEQRDLQEMRERGRGSALFEAESESQLLSMGRRLRSFEKYWVPVIGVVLVLRTFGPAIYNWSHMTGVEELLPVRNALESMGFVAAMALIFFVMGRYTAGLSERKEWRLLRAGAAFSMGMAAMCVVAIVGLAAAHFDAPQMERVSAYAILCILLAVGVDILINQILDFYRPRIEGQEWRPAFDSRLFGILASRRGILKTVAETLDYQFGFNVSETWFYRFMVRALAPIVLFQLVTFWLLTCFFVLQADEQAIVERFGVPRREAAPAETEAPFRALGPGLHVKLPWPFDRVFREKTGKVHEIVLGRSDEHEDYRRRPGARVDAVLWTESHFRTAYQFMMAGQTASESEPTPDASGDAESAEVAPVDMIEGQVSVHYRIRNLSDYLYRNAAPRKLLETLSYQELVRFLAERDMKTLLAAGRQNAGNAVLAMIQSRCDAGRLGVEVVFVGFQDIHPPIQAAQGPDAAPEDDGKSIGLAFEDVISAEEEMQAMKFEALADSTRIHNQAEGEAAEVREGAAAYEVERASLAEAEAEAFRHRLTAYRKSPSVYKNRKKMEAVEDALGPARKLIIPAGTRGREVTILDLPEKLPGGGVLGIDLEQGAEK